MRCSCAGSAFQSGCTMVAVHTGYTCSGISSQPEVRAEVHSRPGMALVCLCTHDTAETHSPGPLTPFVQGADAARQFQGRRNTRGYGKPGAVFAVLLLWLAKPLHTELCHGLQRREHDEGCRRVQQGAGTLCAPPCAAVSPQPVSPQSPGRCMGARKPQILRGCFRQENGTASL